MSSSRKNGQLFAGILIAGLGVILAVERFSGFEIHGLFHLWPLIVIGFGVARLVSGGSTKERSSGLFLVFLGSWFLINTLHIYGLDWGESWPILLILLGLSKLILPEDGRRSGGLLLLAIGAWTFVSVFGVWDLDWDNSWPIAVILVGLFIVWRALFDNAPSRQAKEVSND